MTAITYCVIQEGGTSEELYLNGYDSREDAVAFQKDCEEDGSYRTSQILEIPTELAEAPEFWPYAERLVSLHLTIEYQSERDDE